MNNSILKGGSWILLTTISAEAVPGLVHAVNEYYYCVPRASVSYVPCVPQPKFPFTEPHFDETSSTFSSSGPGFVIK